MSDRLWHRVWGDGWREGFRQGLLVGGVCALAAAVVWGACR